MKTILVISPSLSVKGGITTVLKGYLNTELSGKYNIIQVSSYRDGNTVIKLLTAINSLLFSLYYLMSKKIDLVHIHGSDTTSSLRKYFLFKIVERFDLKVIYHFHGASFMELYSGKNQWWKNRIRYLFKNVDMVICLSDSWVDQIKQIIPSAKTFVIKNAVKLPPDFAKASIRNSKQVRLLFLGLIGERKGVFDLLKAVHTLKEKGYPIRLYIGGNGDVPRLKKAILNLRLQETVSFLGWIGNKKKMELFKKCDIYVLPSYGEGMPMSILEAMSYGLPVVSTRVGGIPELVTDNETGFLIEPGDCDDMSYKIETLITDVDLRARMNKNARDKIQNHYNLELNIKKIDHIYNDLMAGRVL